MNNTDRIVFITGNSRSGTTLMMRLLNNHGMVHAINEPHFFEAMWTNSDKGKNISFQSAKKLLCRLIVRQREGFFEDPAHFKSKYNREVDKLISGRAHWTKEDVYRAFVRHETLSNGKKIPCEKTPQNVFYIEEILDLFPQCTIVNMIRDPRDVLLSQKMKWKRPALGAGFMTKKEVRRLRINYHPITISKLWNSAIYAYKRYAKDPRVIGVRFEDLINDTSAVLSGICSTLEIDYEPSMLNVPYAGSSTRADSQDMGIRKVEKSDWLYKGLKSEEISICQDICGEQMGNFNYQLVKLKTNALKKLGYYLSFPLKLIMAFLVNLNRMKSIKETLTKRLGLS